mmetsp:Transcript_26208/g.23195  ORF Transcript_26208/g.23195 Transcript_26208/m.23195 type:complete len:80 (+) Transcript_26208:359-598(+)
MSSGLFNFSFGLGQMFGPVFGSYSLEIIGFRDTATFVGIILIIYSGVYYFVCVHGKEQSNIVQIAKSNGSSSVKDSKFK